MIWMQGGGTLARNTGPRQWAKPALIQHRLHNGLVGELTGVARHPIAGQGFQLLGRGLGSLVQAAVAFDLAHLLAHSRAKQGMLIGKTDADAIASLRFATPCDIAWVAGAGTERGDMQIDRSAGLPGTWPIARNATATDSAQALAGQGRRGTLDQLDSDIIRVR